MLIFSDDMQILSVSLLLRTGVSKLKGQIGSNALDFQCSQFVWFVGSFVALG